MTGAREQNSKQPNGKGAAPTRSFEGSGIGPGSQIGHFRIEQELGRGGMGVVYLARDTKLDRMVAIKSIPPGLADNPKAQSRFRREAKLLASLNRPDIATIHDIIESDQGPGYLILEYIPGDTLADRLAKGPLKLQEALSIGEQTAESLAAAHEHGIIHRDLKPANIKITEEGGVKVLDFGVAKAVSGEARDAQSTVTEPGRMIGTPAYMSPEQARGMSVDKRTDIWAFGCCLYESLTGEAAFGAETESDTVARILGGEPDWAKLPSATPRNIRVLLHRCLQKDLKRRLQDIGDARIELSDAISPDASSWGEQATEAGRARAISLRLVVPLCLACLILGALLAGASLWSSLEKTRLPVPQAKRVFVEPLLESTLLMSRGGSVALSPDGGYLAYVGVDSAGTRRLYIRVMMHDPKPPRAIRGTEGACGPFFRPDGQWIGFFAEDESTAEFTLKRVRVRGGQPEFICRVPPLPCGGCWSQDDRIVFSPIHHQSVVSVAAFGDGNVLEYPARLDPNNDEHGQLWPDILPEGKGILYTVWGGDSCTDYRTKVKWKDVAQPEELLSNSSFARYVPATGHIVFMRQGSLQAVPFDIDRPGPESIRGEPQIVLGDLGTTIYGGAQFAFSREEGTLVYASGSFPLGIIQSELVWVDPNQPAAAAAPVPQSIRYYDEWSRPRLSPDENWIALTTADETNLLLYKFGTGYSRPFANMTGYQSGAVWQPKPGNHLAFYSLGADSPPDVFWKLFDSTDKPELLLKTLNSEQPCSFSPDGKYLALTVHHVSETHLAQTSDIWIIEPETGNRIEWTETSHCSEWGAAFSPDGRWIAYTSDELGQRDVYVRPFQEGQAERIGSGCEVMWGPNRQKLELFYRGGGQMWRARIRTEPEFDIISREALFEDVYLTTAFPGHRNYDYSGKRNQFLMMRQIDERPTPVTQLNVVLNWFEQLKQLVPPAND